MKKIIYSLFAVLLFVSCSNEVKFSDPGFQANKNNTVWKAYEFSANKDANGAVTITATAEDGTVILKTGSSAKGTYILGTSNTNNIASHKTTSSNGSSYFFDTTPIKGPVAAITSLFSGGTAYTASTNAATTTNGNGAGLTVAISVSAGTVTNASILSPGNNYYTGDVVTISGGNNFANFAVLNVEGSNGEIIITDNSNGTISGTFQFNAKGAIANPNGSENVGFQKGNFYRIPIK